MVIKGSGKRATSTASNNDGGPLDLAFWLRTNAKPPSSSTKVVDIFVAGKADHVRVGCRLVSPSLQPSFSALPKILFSPRYFIDMGQTTDGSTVNSETNY